MKVFRQLLLIALITTTILSCTKEGTIPADTNDDMINKIMSECLENPLTSETEIENNLIGEWLLIEYRQTVFPETPAPIIRLNFTDSILVFENQSENLVETYQWKIEESSLSLIPESNYIALDIHVFCEKYMYVHTIPILSQIGYTFIYEKNE